MGMLAAAAAVIPLGLLSLRPFQRWVPTGIQIHLNPSGHRNKLIRITQQGLLTLKPWRRRSYLTKGVALGRIPSRREVVQTDASFTGWGAVWQHRAVRGQWDSWQKRENINTLELRAVLLALKHFALNLEGLTCSCQVRQYFSDLSHQPSRGHKIQPVSSSITGAVDLGLPSVGEYQSNAHPRSDKCGGGLLVTPQTSVGRVETQPRGGGDDMAALWQSGSRPLCLGSIDPVPPLVFTSRGIQSSGAGCFSPRLARSVTVCLSPYTIDLATVHRVLQGHHRLLLVAPNWPGRPWFPVTYRLLEGEKPLRNHF